MAFLDFLSVNNWKRPIYFVSPSSVKEFLDLKGCFWQEGWTSRFLPICGDTIDINKNIATSIMYDNIMSKFKWGGLDKRKIYADDQTRSFACSLRSLFATLSDALIDDNKIDSAVKVLDKCIEVVPDRNVPYDKSVLPIAENYYDCNKCDKANAILKRLFDINEKMIVYCESLDQFNQISMSVDRNAAKSILQNCLDLTEANKQIDLNKKFKERASKLKVFKK